MFALGLKPAVLDFIHKYSKNIVFKFFFKTIQQRTERLF